MRRGLCPGIAEPIQTGDGLLARLTPGAAIPVHAFIALCEASERDGNGIVEITQRGSVQIRGLTPSSASDFARTVESLGLGDENRPALLSPPLAGIDATATVDVRPLLEELRLALSNRPDSAALGPKVSVVVDSDGELHLDALPADIRLRMASTDEVHIAIGGNAHESIALGWIAPNQVLAMVDELLARITARGRDARARNLTSGSDIADLKARFGHRAAPIARPPIEPIGLHHLKGGVVALGMSPAFGHTTAATLQRTIRTAEKLGATQVRPAPGRALLFIELSLTAAHELAAIADTEGFIVAPNDSRRHVFACAGSPACGSATFSTRDLAPAIAKAAHAWLDRSTTVHLSGCGKGCAHPGAASLTLAGPDRLILNGRAGDESNATLPPRALIAGLERLGAELSHTQSSLSKLGTARVIECLTGVTRHA